MKWHARVTASFAAAPLFLAVITGDSGDARAAEEGASTSHPTQNAPPDARPWLYVDGAIIPSPWTVLAVSRLTYASGDSDTRPFASNTAHLGMNAEAGVEVGILPWMSIAVSGIVGGGISEQPGGAGASGGVRFAPFASSWKNAHLTLMLGGLREIHGDNGAFARVAFGYDIGDLRLASTLHAEHVFAPGRDPADVMLMMGANYKVLGPLRLGAEYVGQDLEETFDDEAEGGVRHFIGPTASVEFFDRRLSIVAGPSFGLSPNSPRAVGRLGIAFGF